MAKRSKKKQSKALIGRKLQLTLLPLFVAIGAGMIILVVLSVITLPKGNPGATRGVGADGFRAYTEEKTDLGVRSVMTKSDVTTALGGKAKSIGEAQVSKVFNFNGDRSQTLTFPFVRSDGVGADIYVDLKLYKNTQSLDDDHIYNLTAKAGSVKGYQAYYRVAQTIGKEREYHIMVVNGLRVYRFVVSQPATNVTISEIDAAALLKSLAAESKL